MALNISRDRLVSFALACGVVLCSPAWAGKGADLILTNAHVYTADPKLPWAEAVAVKDGKIVYVGSSADAKAKGGGDTKEIDLAGRLLLPGFNDGHNHFYKVLYMRLWAHLGDRGTTHTMEVYRKAIEDYRATHPGLKQLMGYGYDSLILPAIAKSQKRQPRELLDDIVSDIPVVIRSWQGHHAWVNSKALELAGVTKDTANPSIDPASGFTHDDTTGEPNGLMSEVSTWNYIYAALPQDPYFSVEEYRS